MVNPLVFLFRWGSVIRLVTNFVVVCQLVKKEWTIHKLWCSHTCKRKGSSRHDPIYALSSETHQKQHIYVEMVSSPHIQMTQNSITFYGSQVTANICQTGHTGKTPFSYYWYSLQKRVLVRTGRKIGLNCGIMFLETLMRKRSILCKGIPLWTQFLSCKLKVSLISIESYRSPITALANNSTSHIQSQLHKDYHICQVVTITHVDRIVMHTVCPHSDPQIDDLMCWRWFAIFSVTNWWPCNRSKPSTNCALLHPISDSSTTRNKVTPIRVEGGNHTLWEW